MFIYFIIYLKSKVPKIPIIITALVLEILAGVLMIIDAKKAGTSPSG